MLYAIYIFCSWCQLELHEYRLVSSIITDDLTLVSANTTILYENVVVKIKQTLTLESVQIIKQSMLMSFQQKSLSLAVCISLHLVSQLDHRTESGRSPTRYSSV
jgi:hypothetical protein